MTDAGIPLTHCMPMMFRLKRSVILMLIVIFFIFTCKFYHSKQTRAIIGPVKEQSSFIPVEEKVKILKSTLLTPFNMSNGTIIV